MPKTKAALLDVDGTLVDSNDAHARAWVRALAELGHDVAYERVRALIGKGGDKLLPETIGVESDSREGKSITARRSALFEAAALRSAGCDPSEAIMLGDTPYDVEAATRAGVAAVALRCGGWSDDALAGAAAIYDDPRDLLAHLGSSPFEGAANGTTAFD